MQCDDGFDNFRRSNPEKSSRSCLHAPVRSSQSFLRPGDGLTGRRPSPFWGARPEATRPLVVSDHAAHPDAGEAAARADRSTRGRAATALAPRSAGPRSTLSREVRLMLRLSCLILVLVSIAGAPGSARAQTGTLTGRVLAGKEPALGADVHVLGTKLGAAVADDGGFRIAGVPVGSRILRIRYQGWLP